MDPTTVADPISRPKPNGILTRKQQQQLLLLPPTSLYRECLKNHAASLGGHALDGCGEFMPSPSSNPSNPFSLTCAACGCHRNFHRRALLLDYDTEDSGGVGGGASSQNDADDDTDDGHRSASPPAPSAPHMLLALSTGAGGGGAAAAAAAAGPAARGARPPPTTTTTTTTAGVGGVLPRKRFRSKFSPEQKERMQELSERLGWRMQRRDDGIIEATCREIGVGKGVFKVWMHNNKHNFVLKNCSNASSSSANVSATAAIGSELDLCGEVLVHHHHHNNEVNGSAADSSP